MFDPGIIGFIFAFVIVLIFLYNRFVVLRQRVKNAWSQIEVLLKRRSDLVPELVNVVKAYAKHEQDVFINITMARNLVEASSNLEDIADAEKGMTKSLKGLFAVAENYPELKADKNFMELQKELTDTENKITFARQFYNDTVQKYNTKIEMFPNNIVAKVFKFKKSEYFNITEKSIKTLFKKKKWGFAYEQ